MNPIARSLSLILSVMFVSVGLTQQTVSPVQVTVKDGKIVAEAAEVPVDPTPRIAIGQTNGMYFGLSVEGKRITISPQGGIWSGARVDNQEMLQAFDQNMMRPLPLAPGPFGKKRHGTQASWTIHGMHVTQTVEIVPSKAEKGAAGQKRKLDTARISYLVENKDTKAHNLEWRVGIDILIVHNDGALFASPTTHPGKVLDGVMLKDKGMPEYIQVLQQPNLQAPGYVATMTLKPGGRAEGPNRIVMTGLGAFGAGWEIPAQQANGDSACALYWEAKMLKPGEKREMAWAYGGGLAGSIENEGKMAVALGGSFEPGKQFTLSAFVDDPVPGQTLTLELPAGMTRLEGKEIQPVPAPGEKGSSLVLWKARVLQPGDFEVKVRSSTGVTQVKHISVKLASP